MSKRMVLRVSESTMKTLRLFAEQRGIDVGAAADRMVATAAGRMKSVAKYAKRAGR